MADLHNENVPAVGNSIAADIPDIKENLEWHKDLLQMILGWKNDTIATVGPPNHRSKFRWKDADEIYIGPGSYFHDGTTRQTVFWDSELTFKLGSGGSNAGSDDVDAGAQAVHYIYLDDSAIVTQASPELDAGCLLNTDVTAPTWSDAKHGWYNGSDRCIFAVIADSGDEVLEFFHDGGEYVSFTDSINDFALADPGTDFATEVTLSIPAFVMRANVYAVCKYIDAGDTFYWRNTDSAGTGSNIAYVNEGSVYVSNSLDVMVNSSLKIDIKTASGDNQIAMDTNGWYFPNGM